MTNNCNSKNPLQRDGTSQQQRVLKSLLPGYVAVDERSIEDLKKFAQEYAKEIAYYNIDNTLDPDPLKNNWFEFFNKQINSNTADNSPHFVLFMAFLKLFKHAQNEINKITKKHLDFYYRDVLQMTENPAVPDQVYLIFELAKHVSTHLLKKGTAFKAGKDALGNNVTYQLDKEAVLNKAAVSELKAVFTNKHDIFKDVLPYPANHYRIYASPVANSQDGEGADLTNEDKSWRTFGGVNFSDPRNPVLADREKADTGFAFASPNLFLAEGERIVTIYLNLSKSASLPASLTNDMMYDAFRLKFSGKEKWIEPIWLQKGTSAEVDSIVAMRILDFLNQAKSPADIAGIEPVEGPVYDHPEKGYGDNIRDYDIGLTVAERIILERDKLPGKKFTSLKQVRNIKYVGKDKIDDLVYSFGDPVHSTTIDRVNNRIIIRRTITKDQEAIVGYNKEKLLDPFLTKWPVVKILLNPESKTNPFVYKYLKDLKIAEAHIVVDVREVRNLILQNDQSVLDPGKPFQPFGNRPQKGSGFFIGSPEVFQKALNEIQINIMWLGLPEDDKGFETYYENYHPNSPKRTNSSFVTEISLLDKKIWVPVKPDSKYLFSWEDGKLVPKHNILLSNNDPAGEPPTTLTGDVERDEKLQVFDEYNQESQKGFIKLSLPPDSTDFGHREFQQSYTNAVLNAINPGNGSIENYTNDLPNEPYTPEIEELSLNYTSSEKIIIEKLPQKDYKVRIEQFFHIHPLGVEEIKTTNKSNHLLPQYNHEGELYIGIKNLVPPGNLSVLFQISEGTSNPDLTPPPVEWSYLSGNEWKPLPPQNILSDSTKGMITTGLVQFAVPSDAGNINTILTNGLHWLRASVEKDSFGIPHIIEVKCQAAKAVFKNNNNDPDYLRKPMAEKTISKMENADSAIKKIEQPFTSFGGKVAEESNAFYTRVSERLRHKNRAITIWDYERIILHNFPAIYKVKCLNHTSYQGTYSSINEAAPGHVSLIVVSNIRNKNATDPLKPRTSLVELYNIEEYLKNKRSPYINLHIFNPLFEEIQVDFNVQFYPGYDKGIYQTKLNEAIVHHLSPWAFEDGSDIVFGGRIHKSVLLNFVEEQSYVDYVTCFKMYLIVPDEAGNQAKKDIDEAVASTSASILVSAPSHIIDILEKENECDCPDNEVRPVDIASSDDCSCD